MSLLPEHAPFCLQLAQIVGEPQVLQGIDAQMYHTDERLRYHHPPIAVVRPSETQQISALVQLCAEHQIAIIPQGGNTGLVGGCAVLPDTPSILLNLNRLNRILDVDPLNQTMRVQAGVTLAQVQAAASAHNLLFPLSLASQDSATIGGNLATNAGGMQVLRYGTMRDLCMGIEVILANGQTLSALNGLRKNNTGYDLKHLFIGSEGTLGIITTAVLKLYPAPITRQVALIASEHAHLLMEAFCALRQNFDAQLTAFEYISPKALELVCTHLSCAHPWAAYEWPQSEHLQSSDHRPASGLHSALIEISHNTSAKSPLPSATPLETALDTALETVLDALLTKGLVHNAIIANSLGQAQHLWQLRERISSAQKAQGPNIKHDISLPISAIVPFVHSCAQTLEYHYPGIEPMVFGHIGDGNLHYNVSQGSAFDSAAALMQQESSINALVYEQVQQFHGSISAEHGIGLLKRAHMRAVKDPVELATMIAIKHALDPHNLMNPHKVLPNLDAPL